MYLYMLGKFESLFNGGRLYLHMTYFLGPSRAALINSSACDI